MNNEPVAWIIDVKMTDCDDNFIWNTGDYPDWQVKDWIPLYTHPVKEQDEPNWKEMYWHMHELNHKHWSELYALKAHPVKELTDEEWNKAFDFYCETDEGVLKFDLELRDEWKKEQLIRWKEALKKAQEL